AREDSAVAAIFEGDRHLDASEMTQAQQWYQQAIRYAPEYPVGYECLGDLTYNQGRGDIRQADNYWQRAIELYTKQASSPDEPTRTKAEADRERTEHKA